MKWNRQEQKARSAVLRWETKLVLTQTDLAKYPFTPQAAEHVQKLDLKITELDSPEYSRIVERAEKRIEEAITSALVNEQTRSNEIEIPSFPIAVIMVAVANDAFLKKRYALAEAKRAYSILKQESKQKLSEIAQIFDWKIKQPQVVSRSPSTTPSDFAIHFTNYLKNTGNLRETKWKLVNRTMVNGEVSLTKGEAARLLAEEVRAHIEKKLEQKIGFTLPPAVIKRAERLKQLALTKRGQIRQEEMPKETTVEAFPPCIRQLYSSAQSGRHISHIGRFTLTSFLINSGMPAETVIECFRPASDFSERMTRYQVEHIAGDRGSRTKYIPPRCDTLRTHGVCPGMDETCRGRQYPVRHPLAYYRRKLKTIKTQTPATATRA